MHFAWAQLDVQVCQEFLKHARNLWESHNKSTKASAWSQAPWSNRCLSSSPTTALQRPLDPPGRKPKVHPACTRPRLVQVQAKVATVSKRQECFLTSLWQFKPFQSRDGRSGDQSHPHGHFVAKKPLRPILPPESENYNHP